MLIALFFGGVSVPCHVEDFPLDRLSVFIEYLDFVCCKHNGFVIFNEVYLFDIFQQSWYVGSHEVATFAEAHDERCVFSHRDDLVRLFLRYGYYGVCSAHLLNSGEY